MDFAEKVAVVTGAASGIGAATAELLARLNADLVLGDRDEAKLIEVAERCRFLGADVEILQFDQRSSPAADQLIATAMERFGKIDALANVAGITHFATTVDTSDDEWNNVQATNLAGVFYCCRAAMREMLKQKSGSIVNVSSASAVAPYAGVGAYAAAKAGLHGYSRVLALEAAPHVRVNVVAPGPVDTELFRATVLSPEGDTDGLRGNIQSEIAATVPLGRVGLPIDLARTIAFLLSDWAAFTTGQVLHVNGGRAMR